MKIADARSRLEMLRDELKPSGLLVGYSGGKDSLACLDLAHQVFQDGTPLAALHLYILPGMDFERPRIDLVRRRFKLPVVSLPHPALTTMIRHSIYRPAASAGGVLSPENRKRYGPPRSILSGDRGKAFKWNEIEAIARSRLDCPQRLPQSDGTGGIWLIYGHRKQDSLFRRGMLSANCDEYGFWPEYLRLYPIFDWTAADVVQYLKVRRLPLPLTSADNVYGTNGVSFDERFLQMLRGAYPRDYQRLTELFPLVESILIRDELRNASAAATGTDDHDETQVG